MGTGGRGAGAGPMGTGGRGAGAGPVGIGGGAQARVQWDVGAQARVQWGMGAQAFCLKKWLYIYLRAKVIVLLKAGANLTTDNDDRMSYYGKGHAHRHQTKYRHKHAL